MKNRLSPFFSEKKRIIGLLMSLLLSTLITNGQIATLNPANGSITITPKGIKGSTDNITDSTNIAFGTDALRSNTSGHENTALGIYTLRSNSTGHYNTAVGYRALISNTTGSSNTAMGDDALRANSTGTFNTANGAFALKANIVGAYNTAAGYFAMYSNLSGGYNTANGISALNANTTGYFNTAAGGYSLPANTTGSNNTVFGYLAGTAIISGSNNTFLGANSDATSDFSNATALGYNAKVNAGNKVRIGDENVTVIEGQVAWSNPSDIRLKENIIYTSRLGLDFIDRLQTVSYNYVADKSKIRYDGFIAQDIEKVMKELSLPFSGLKKSDTNMYSLAYSDFVIPLVNAVKEQQQQIRQQQKQIDEMKKQNNALEIRLSALEQLSAGK